MSNQTRLILMESVFALTCAQIAVRLCFRAIAPWAMRPRAKADALPPVEMQKLVKRSIKVAVKNLPWESVCLPNAIAAKMLLARRGYGSTIHLGVGWSKEQFMAHAWLDAGGEILTGQDAMDGLTNILN